MKVGFIGLGIMGSRMAANLQQKGHQLVVFNRTPDKAQALVAGGALLAASPAEVTAQQPDVIITMLAHPDAVEAAALGEAGFLAEVAPGTVWLECSTVNPTFTRQMAAAAQAKHVRFLDAPVAGSKAQAEQGQLVFFVGGQAVDLEQCQPLLEAMGAKVLHLGEVGMGIAMKMVVNALLASSMVAFAEAMQLGQALGLPAETLLGNVIGGAVAAPFLAGKKEKFRQADYSPDFPLRWMHKDLQMVAQTAQQAQVTMPVAQAAQHAYLAALQAGLGDLDFSAIYQSVTTQPAQP